MLAVSGWLLAIERVVTNADCHFERSCSKAKSESKNLFDQLFSVD